MNDIIENEPGQELVPAPGKQARRAVAKVAPAPSTPMDLIAMAVARGDSVETIDKLMALAERLDKIQAQKAYVMAMARFKQNPPRIEKTRTADITSRREDAASYAYKFANLADVCEKIVAGLAEVGISHRWKTQQDAGQVAVTCILTHELGHSESTMLSAGLDQSGKKNSLQALGSTVSYLNRYTLLAATGLAVDDQQDDDGNGLSEEERNAVGDAVKQSRSRPQHKPADIAAQRGNGPAPDAELLAQANAAAARGTAHFGPYWRGLSQNERDALASKLQDLQRTASASGK